MVSIHIGGGGIRATFVSQCLNNLFSTNSQFFDAIEVTSGVGAGSIVATCIATNTSLDSAVQFLNSKSFVKQKNVCGSAFALYQMWNNTANSFYDNEFLHSAMCQLFYSKKCKLDLCIAVANVCNFEPVSCNLKKMKLLSQHL